MKVEPLFYIPAANSDQDVAGPYDLVQMARLLRLKIITPETLTFLEGEQEWIVFSKRPQFIVASEMSPDAESQRVAELEAAAKAPRSSLPLPSAEFMVKAGGVAILTLSGAGAAAFLGWADVTMGLCLAVVSGAASAVGQCMIWVRLWDEDWIVKLMVAFIPFFDIYYFVSNMDEYLPYFLAKYVGAILCAATLFGVASNNSQQADEIRGILQLHGL